MIDKQFEMRSETPGPAIAHRLNPENDYRPERLADLLGGEDLDKAQDWYALAILVPGATKAQAFIRAIMCMLWEKEGGARERSPDPNRLFTANEMKIAIEFFAGKEVSAEHITMWVKGIDPYDNEIDCGGKKPEQEPEAGQATISLKQIQEAMCEIVVQKHHKHVGQGIDPYMVGNPADLDEF